MDKNKRKSKGAMGKAPDKPTKDAKEESKPVLEFKVYRENPNDPFKPTSETAVKTLATHPRKEVLQPDDELLLQSVAADLERSLSVEEIITLPYPEPNIDTECKVEISKLPTWLRSMIRAKYAVIHDHFKGDTLKFLRNLVSKIAQRDLMKSGYSAFDFGKEAREFEVLETDFEEKEPEFYDSPAVRAALRAVQAVGKFKRKKAGGSKAWEKPKVEYACEKLRECLALKAGAHDLLIVEEDASIKRQVEEEEASSEEEEEHQADRPKWENMFAPGQLEEETQAKVDKILLKHQPDEDEDEEEKVTETEGKEKGAKDKNEKKGKSKKKKKQKEKRQSKSKRPRLSLPKIQWMERKREKEKDLAKRGHFREHAKLFYTGCGDAVPPPERLEHHHRFDESFHAFCVALVAWRWFQVFIMCMIFLNALVLAAETFDVNEEHYIVFDVFDEFFLAIYLTEAIVKIYAHPFRYWTSGFNVFDFIIVLVSLIKSIIDWLNVAEIAFLRVFLIVRALRVLRSISLSIQLQVLVTALVETVKKHVLSVVILLTLLIYIAAIVAYYLFGERLATVWGFVPQGMLRMVSYVTLDGWADLQKEFEEAGLMLEGRIFNLICIVLGNFMFSNIFIAIIIFNISEATDLFRERIRTERESLVKRKKETVFRRQKLDMRQLLARQKKAFSADFFFMASQFQKLLRHDDLVAMKETCTSPLWIDAAYQTLLRTTHTSNILLNLHREMADNILLLHRFHGDNKMQEYSISRGRYNRYMKIKAKLELIKREILRFRNTPKSPNDKLRIRFGKSSTQQEQKPMRENKGK